MVTKLMANHSPKPNHSLDKFNTDDLKDFRTCLFVIPLVFTPFQYSVAQPYRDKVISLQRSHRWKYPGLQRDNYRWVDGLFHAAHQQAFNHHETSLQHHYTLWNASLPHARTSYFKNLKTSSEFKECLKLIHIELRRTDIAKKDFEKLCFVINSNTLLVSRDRGIETTLCREDKIWLIIDDWDIRKTFLGMKYFYERKRRWRRQRVKAAEVPMIVPEEMVLHHTPQSITKPNQRVVRI